MPSGDNQMGLTVQTTKVIRPGYRRETYWTVAEACEYSGLSVVTIYRYMRQGYFVTRKSATPYKVEAASFMNYIQTGLPSGNIMYRSSRTA